ncbi:MAG: prolipoprotein diacylglyceryl transferase [Candidatus Omnitrophica bacterium]|jgi:phosphatidylglycerol:prolipoprotein diacylglycerol transferase|nr:prolipoprotein diacylglyceryl transferase [Candidatus Omnitrophota bacterium]MDD5690088.1 prolipoprotein diacylglyceryl transferase [Candidatus Omnitrophota bacterium]
MLPEICHIGPFTIYSYGLMLVLAFFVSAYLASRQAEKTHIDADKIFNLCFYVFISGIIGSRIFYVVSNFPFYFKHPLEIIMLQHGGMAIFGGIIFGSIFACLFIIKNKMDLLLTLDLLAPFIALGQAIGRIGCFLNGCCYGKVSAFGIYFPSSGQVLIPTQLYSSLCMFLIFLALRFMQNRKHLPGQILYFYLFFYSVKRFFIEFFRNDSPRIFQGLTLFQLLSLAMFFFSLTMLIRLFYFKKK